MRSPDPEAAVESQGVRPDPKVLRLLKEVLEGHYEEHLGYARRRLRDEVISLFAADSRDCLASLAMDSKGKGVFQRHNIFIYI